MARMVDARGKRLGGLALCLALPIIAYAAGDPEAGREKAEPCAACHGATGISVSDLWPNLAAQKEGYLIKQLKAYRDGTRTDPIMSTFARSLTDQDIADLAAYFSQLPPVGMQESQDWYNRRRQEKAE